MRAPGSSALGSERTVGGRAPTLGELARACEGPDARAELSARVAAARDEHALPEFAESTLPTEADHAQRTVTAAFDRTTTAAPEEPKAAGPAAPRARGLVGAQLHAFEVLEQLGRGSYGEVYRARHRYLNTEVAIKVLHTGLVGVRRVRERILREAQLLAGLRDPRIVAVLDFGLTDDGRPFMVLELIAGRTLDDAVAAEGPLPSARAARVLADIAGALAAAHAVGVVHRDLKPANVMLTNAEAPSAKVLDFGVSRALYDERTQLTRAGELVGTPLFMAPEQLRGEPAGPAADLFALGAIGHLMLTGRTHFVARTMTELLDAHARWSLDAPSGDAHLGPIVARLLARAPEDRFPSAQAVLEALKRPPPRPRRSPLTFLAPAAVGAALLIFAASRGPSGSGTSPPAPPASPSAAERPPPEDERPRAIAERSELAPTPPSPSVDATPSAPPSRTPASAPPPRAEPPRASTPSAEGTRASLVAALTARGSSRPICPSSGSTRRSSRGGSGRGSSRRARR